VDQQERISTQAAHLGLDNGHYGCTCYSGIHCVAAGTENIMGSHRGKGMAPC
jgi:hypothetical protein